MSIKFIVVFHVNMLQQLYIPVYSSICKHDKYHLKLFNSCNIANNNVNSTLKVKGKLD